MAIGTRRADLDAAANGWYLPVDWRGLVDTEHGLASERVLLANGEVIELLATSEATYFRMGESGVWLREVRVDLPQNLIAPIAGIGPANPFETPSPDTPQPISMWRLASIATSATLVGPKDVNGGTGSLYSITVPVNEDLFTAIGGSPPSTEDLAAIRDALGAELLLDMVLDETGRPLMLFLVRDGEGVEFQWWAYDEAVEIAVPADDEVTSSMDEYYRLHSDS